MNFLVIIFALALGIGLQKFPLPHVRLVGLLNRYVLWVALPALVFRHLTGLEFEWSYFWMVSVAWLSFFAAWLWVWLMQKRFALDRATAGCLLLTCGLGNTSFVGIPLVTGLLGHEVLSDALLIDQLGSFLILSTLGLVGAAFYSGKQPRKREVIVRMARFPPFLCFGTVLILNILGWDWNPGMDRLWELLGATLAPASLVAVGMQIRWNAFGSLKVPLISGLFYRLVISPALIWLAYQSLFSGRSLEVAVLEAGMAPMITAGIVAASQGLNPRLATAMVSLGTLISFVSVPLWYFLMQSG